MRRVVVPPLPLAGLSPSGPPPRLDFVPPAPLTVEHSQCPSCGLSLDSAMAYCCPRGNCPVGLGGATC